MRITVITGLSGSGKSTAVHAFEDRGHFCVDNLPVTMIPALTEAVGGADRAVERIVLCIDAREWHFLADYTQVVEKMRAKGHVFEVFYLESRDDVLIRRFSQTRRRHPLAEGDIIAGLEQEKQLLAGLRQQATHVIDTSDITIHELKQVLYNLMDANPSQSNLAVTLLSFGYKFGVPLDADLVFDMRFLPNPYFVPELKARTGREEAVSDYVFSTDDARQMRSKLEEFAGFLLPRFEAEGKTYLTIAIGCTGGKHRSVAMACALNDYIKETLPRFRVFLRHRDLGKE